MPIMSTKHVRYLLLWKNLSPIVFFLACEVSPALYPVSRIRGLGARSWEKGGGSENYLDLAIPSSIVIFRIYISNGMRRGRRGSAFLHVLCPCSGIPRSHRKWDRPCTGISCHVTFPTKLFPPGFRKPGNILTSKKVQLSERIISQLSFFLF